LEELPKDGHRMMGRKDERLPRKRSGSAIRRMLVLTGRLFAAMLFLASLAVQAAAQQPIQPPLSSEPVPGLLPPRPPQLPPAPPPPRAPELELPAPPAKAEPGEGVAAPKIFVKEVRLTGNSAFTPDELAEVTAPYTNRDLTAEDLESLRLALTMYYVNRGYVTSGALIPEQTVADGILDLQIV
jgi:hemolysin activation/secretion protein